MRDRALKTMLFITLLITMSVTNVYSDEILALMRNCMKGNHPNEPIYISFLPFVDHDTKTSSFMTEHASIIFEDMKKFFTELQPIVGLQINSNNHTVPPNDSNVNKILDIIASSGMSENEKFVTLKNKFLDPYQTDIIITATYRNNQDALEMILYFIVKSKRRIIASDVSFSKLTFFCEKMIPFSRASKTVLCKDNEDVSLYIYLKFFLDKLCPGLMDQLTGNKNKNNNNSNAAGNNQFAQKSSAKVYVSQLSFMDPYLGYSLNNTPQGDLIDQAVSDGIHQAAQSNSSIAFNASGHVIENTNPNCNKLINIIFDPNLDQKQKMTRISSDILTPHNADCIVTGQLISQRKPPDLRIMLIRSNQIIDSQQVPVNNKLFCLDRNNPTKKMFCPGMRDRIVDAVSVLLKKVNP